MNKAEDKKQGDGGRFKGTTFQDLLDQETVGSSGIFAIAKQSPAWR
jgi:hypothetical protein